MEPHYPHPHPTEAASRTASLRRPMFILLLLFFCLYGLNLWVPRDLWVQDEARYGEVVREMVQTGQWLVPHLNAHPYPDKPPLYFWLVALMGLVMGQGALAFRIVTFLSTLGAMIGVYLVGCRIAGRRVGFWGTALFATMLLSLLVGQIARMDMLLTATSVFAWYMLLRYQAEGGLRWIIAFWSFSALGLAIKGPIALLFTILPATVWMVAVNGWRGIRSLRLISGLAALSTLVLGWVAAVVYAGYGGYLYTIWNEQLVGRAINSWSHREPFYFYLMVAPLVFMPWTSLVIAGGHRLLCAGRRDRGLLSVALFALLPFIAISLISGKLFIYLQPLLPAISIMAALSAERLAAQPSVSAWHRWPAAIFYCLVQAALVWAAFRFFQGKTLIALPLTAALTVLALVVFSLVSWRGEQWLMGWLILSLGISWVLFGSLIYALNPHFSARLLGETVHRVAGPETPVGIVNTTRGILNYYADRTFAELSSEEAATWWQAHQKGLVIVKSGDIETVFGATGIPAHCTINETFQINFKEYHLIGDC